MIYIQWFRDIGSESLSSIGNKGMHLGELFNVGFPIPNGFVITVEAFDRFINLNNLNDQVYDMLDDIDITDFTKLKEASKIIQNITLAADIPEDIQKAIIEAYDLMNTNYEVFQNISKEALDILRSGKELPYIAVRSSLITDKIGESISGQQETFLNVKGNSTLLSCVKKCWASLFTPRAIIYRVKNNISHCDSKIAVIVQKQIASQKSGVVYSINPITHNSSEILIEAGFGLGEAVVSGNIIPDQYILDKNSLRIKETKLNKQDWLFTLDATLGYTIRRNIPEERRNEQKLFEHEIRRLGEFAKKIENYYNGKPQDIEFAIEGMNMHFLQAKPITTTKRVTNEITLSQNFTDEPLLKGTPVSPGISNGKVVLIKQQEDLARVQEGEILVTNATSLDFESAMRKASAIVTDFGGTSSHQAVFSRELKIPCIVGCLTGTKILNEGQFVTVDGYSGKIYSSKKNNKSEVNTGLKEEKTETVTELKLIMDSVCEFNANNEGIGILELEKIIISNGVSQIEYIQDNNQASYVDLLTNEIRKITRPLGDKPVWVRTSDLKSYDILDNNTEVNPLLGWHGIRKSLDDIELLKAELKALQKLHDEGLTNIGVMFPFVINVYELKKAKELLLEVGLEAGESIDVGIVIDTPAAAQIIKELCDEGVDFIAIDLDSLTQLTLGVDRSNEKVSSLFNELHPAVVRQIKNVITMCKSANVETSVFGSNTHNEGVINFFVKAGIDSISVKPANLVTSRQTIAKNEKKLLLSAARKDIRF